MTWIKEHMKIFKLILAALLILFTIFGFVEYFIGNKILETGDKATYMKMISVGKDGALWKTQGIDTVKNGSGMVNGATVYFVTHTVKSINDGDINKGVLSATLAFSLISLISTFVVLGLGTHKNTLISSITLIVGLVLFIVLFALVVTSMHNLSNVNDNITTTTKHFQHTSKPDGTWNLPTKEIIGEIKPLKK